MAPAHMKGMTTYSGNDNTQVMTSFTTWAV
jgi:hypothetical protein